MATDRRPSQWRRRIAVGALALVLLTAAGVLVGGQLWLASQRGEQARESVVRAAAEQAAEQVLSYDYRRLEESAAQTRPLLTGDFRAQYDSLQKPLQRTAPRLKASIIAVVKQSAVLETGDDSARVLLFVDQTTSSRKLEGPQLDQSRVVATLVHEGGRWLVDSLGAV